MTQIEELTAPVFATLSRSRDKLTAEQVAQQAGIDIAVTKAAVVKLFLAGLLHMVTEQGEQHYGVTARGRRIVAAVGLNGVTDELIGQEYRDAMAWQPRRRWGEKV